MGGMRWNDEQDQRVLELANDGIPYGRIVAIMAKEFEIKRTMRGIKVRLNKLRRNGHRPTQKKLKRSSRSRADILIEAPGLGLTFRRRVSHDEAVAVVQLLTSGGVS